MPRAWVYDPHSGGVKIPMGSPRQDEESHPGACPASTMQASTRALMVHFAASYATSTRYRACPWRPVSIQPCLANRVKHISSGYGILRLTSVVCVTSVMSSAGLMAFYTYSNQKYEPCFFNNGTFQGTPEEAFDTGRHLFTGLRTNTTRG